MKLHRPQVGLNQIPRFERKQRSSLDRSFLQDEPDEKRTGQVMTAITLYSISSSICSTILNLYLSLRERQTTLVLPSETVIGRLKFLRVQLAQCRRVFKSACMTEDHFLRLRRLVHRVVFFLTIKDKDRLNLQTLVGSWCMQPSEA